MKKILIMFAVVAMFTACKPVEYDTFATITGTVLDYDNGEPISNALITVTPTGVNTYTGNDGQFQFDDVEAASYTVRAQKTGYGANSKYVNAEAGQTVNVSLTLKKNQ